MIKLWRAFIASWGFLVRHAWMSLATMVVFTVALLSVHTLVAVQGLLARTTQIIEQRIDVTITFRPAAPEVTLQQISFYARSLPQVVSAQLVTATDVLLRFRERHASRPKTLASLQELGNNPFGAQLVIRASRPEDYPAILAAIKNPQYAPYVQGDTFHDHRSAIAHLNNLTRQARRAGIALIIIFAAFSLLIMCNAVRIAVYTRREEIGIMRLVGASAWFIRIPFILQMMWLGLLAIALSWLVSILVWTRLDSALLVLLDGDTGLVAFFKAHAVTLLLAELVGLMVVVVPTTWLAIGRYIRR